MNPVSMQFTSALRSMPSKSRTRCVAQSARGAALCAALAFLLLPSAARSAFVEVPQFGTGATICVAWADADLDGDLDVAVGNYFNQANELYVNNGNGTFTRQTPFGNDNTFAVVFGDYDNDGDPDLAVGNGANQQNRLYVNQGNGAFAVQNQFGLFSTVALAWADYDLDGDLDLAVGNGILGANQQNFLYVNNGDGTFTGVANFGLLQTDSVAWGDFDADGDPDLAVGNGGFGSIQQNYLYVNNGDGTFTGFPEFGTGDTACLAWGDVDRDGDLDLAVGNWNATQCRLYVNNGNFTFTGRDEFGARDTNTLAWGDADLDGDLDVAVGNGDFTTADQNYLYVNDGTGNFTETPEFGLGSTDGVAWGDFDGDGDLDLAVGNEHTPTQNYLYVNVAPAGTWLVLRLVGHFHDLGTGYSNRDGIGAKVSVYEAGFIGQPDHLLGFREIAAHGGFASQNDIAPSFGLPGLATVDVHIVWPGSNGAHVAQDLFAVATGQRLVVHEQGTPAGIDDAAAAPVALAATLRVAPNPMSGFTRLELVIPAGSTGFEGPRNLRVVDVGGRIIRTLAVQRRDAVTGGADWDRRDTAGALVPGGVYFIHLDRESAPSGRIVVVP